VRTSMVIGLERMKSEIAREKGLEGEFIPPHTIHSSSKKCDVRRKPNGASFCIVKYLTKDAGNVRILSENEFPPSYGTLP